MVVVDADSDDAVRQIVCILGDTPGKVVTRRGLHFLFAAPAASLNHYLGPTGGSLRAIGLDVDIKYGASVVMAPPSRHPLDPGFQYRWEGCDETVLCDLPVFDPAPLRALLEGRASKTGMTPLYSSRSSFRKGSRGLALNDALVPVVHLFDDLDDALDYARTFNEKFELHGLSPLEDREVVDRTKQVWKDRDRLERRIGLRATASTDADEIRSIVSQYSNGPDVFALVQLLRAEHGARAARGEGFHISIAAMVERRVLGNWSARRYRNARDNAINAGLIIVLRPGASDRPTVYGLVKRKPNLAKHMLGRT